MVTTIIKTIKPATGGDYTTLNSWEAARTGNLVTRNANYPSAGGDPSGTIEIAEVYGGGNALNAPLQIFWETDATHYAEIRAAAGHEHTGVYNESKAYGKVTSGGYCLNLLQMNAKINKMQFYGDSLTSYVIQLDGEYTPAVGLISVDRCIIKAVNMTKAVAYSARPVTLTNSLIMISGSSATTVAAISGGSSTFKIYNNTIVVANTNAAAGDSRAIDNSTGSTIQNNYIHSNSAQGDTFSHAYVTATGGSNDATSNNRALTANLRFIPYSTATFQNVTPGSENFRLVVSASNKLIDGGANLTSVGVTADIIGTARPLFGAFDIGAFENDIPLCWNYTAQYRGSNKLFKASGCGAFPKSLQVPGNVDTSTGKMVDDGIFISPDKYKIV